MTMEFVANGRMRRGCRFRVLLVIVVLYFVCCTIGGIYLADASLHPGRRALTPEDVAMFQSMLRSVHADLRDVAITTSDQFVLRGWLLRPTRPNGDAVVVLHDVSGASAVPEDVDRLVVAEVELHLAFDAGVVVACPFEGAEVAGLWGSAPRDGRSMGLTALDRLGLEERPHAAGTPIAP